MYCTNCGSEMNNGVCENCNNSSASNINRNSNKNRIPIIACIIVGLVVLLGIGGYIGYRIYFEHECISVVKNHAIHEACDVTYGQAFDEYFTNAEWEYASDGKNHYVNVLGNIPCYDDIVMLQIEIRDLKSKKVSEVESMAVINSEDLNKTKIEYKYFPLELHSIVYHAFYAYLGNHGYRFDFNDIFTYFHDGYTYDDMYDLIASTGLSEEGNIPIDKLCKCYPEFESDFRYAYDSYYNDDSDSFDYESSYYQNTEELNVPEYQSPLYSKPEPNDFYSNSSLIDSVPDYYNQYMDDYYNDEWNDYYILTDTESHYYEYKLLVPLMPKHIARYAINEIYAKHGRKFKNQEIQAYFNAMPWYVGYIEPDDFDESVLNEYEKNTIKTLQDIINGDV